jgi:C4-dicarboxylate-specific signal transduction histidine kinase
VVPRVLVVDDDTECWAPTTRALQQEGHVALVAAANDSVIDLVTAHEIDVVLMDLRSQVQAAMDLLGMVKGASPETEVIVATGTDILVDDALALLRRGAFDIIRKPFGAGQVVSAVLAAIERRQTAHSAADLLRESQRMLSFEERDRLPAMIVDLGQRVMQADVVSLMLRDTRGHLYIAHAQGLEPEVRMATRLQVGQRVAGRIAELRKPVLISAALVRDPRFEDLVPFGRVRSSIVHPLLSGDRLIGVLNIGRSAAAPPFSESDLPRASVIASGAVSALETLRQWQRIGMAERLATVAQVASSAANEINSPLAAIVGQADLALDSVNSLLGRIQPGETIQMNDLRAALAEIKECLGSAQDAALALQEVAHDLRIAAQSDTSFGGRLELNENIRAAVRLATGEARRPTSIVRNVEPGLFVAGDASQLCQAFLSVIHTASRAMRDASTPAPEIQIRSAHVEGGFRVDVIDNGPGIPTDEIARMLEPFHAARGGRPVLGLSIVNEIVQGFGGRLEVTSEAGQGTTFSIYLPAAPIHESVGSHCQDAAASDSP